MDFSLLDFDGTNVILEKLSAFVFWGSASSTWLQCWPEDWSSKHFRNFGTSIPFYNTSYPRRVDFHQHICETPYLVLERKFYSN